MRTRDSRGISEGGNIRPRPDGRWEGRYTADIDPGTGKQIQKSIYGKTKKRCESVYAKSHQKSTREVGAFLRAIEGHRFASLYLVNLFTGMRQGEKHRTKCVCAPVLLGITTKNWYLPTNSAACSVGARCTKTSSRSQTSFISLIFASTIYGIHLPPSRFSPAMIPRPYKRISGIIRLLLHWMFTVM